LTLSQMQGFGAALINEVHFGFKRTMHEFLP
jgi:hypothetical protein